MVYFLDTGVCIDHLSNASSNVSTALEQTPFQSVKIPAMVAATLLCGAEKSVKREYNLMVFKTFLSLFEIVPFDQKASEIYATVYWELFNKEQTIHGCRLAIAATVLANEATLVTNDTDTFAQIDDLMITDWTSDRISQPPQKQGKKKRRLEP